MQTRIRKSILVWVDFVLKKIKARDSGYYRITKIFKKKLFCCKKPFIFLSEIYLNIKQNKIKTCRFLWEFHIHVDKYSVQQRLLAKTPYLVAKII